MITFDAKEMLLRELMELPKAEPKRVYHRVTHVVTTECFSNGAEARKRFNNLKRVR